MITYFDPAQITNILVGIALGIFLLPMLAESVVKPLRILSVVLLVFVGSTHFKTELITIYNQFTGEQTTKIVNLEPGKYYVSAKKLNIRIDPSKRGQLVTTLDRGDEVNVYETKNGWAIVSDYFDGSGYSKSQKVAQWTYALYLSKKQITPIITPATARPLEQKPQDSLACIEAQKSLREWEQFMQRDANNRQKEGLSAVLSAIGQGGLSAGGRGGQQIDAIQQERLRKNLIQKARLRERLINLGC